jgi:hypothetical protein
MMKGPEESSREDPRDVVYWTPAELKRFLALRSEIQVRICELEREYALEQGGLVLKVFEEAYGYLFGKPWIKKDAAVAVSLGVTVEQVEEILDEGERVVTERWTAEQAET